MEFFSSIALVFNNFREGLYQLFPRRADATMELVDALSSNHSADSVVKLSQEPLFRREYGSITDAITNLSHTDDEFHDLQKNSAELLASQCKNSLDKRQFNLFALDATPQQRKFSKVLEDRGFIHYPNPVAGNAPVSIGHQYSLFAYLPEKGEGEPPWILPISVKRVPTDSTSTTVGIEQCQQILSSEQFKNHLNVVAMDSAYGTPESIQKVCDTKNTVSIIRLKNNRKVCAPPPEKRKGFGGPNTRYGKEMHLNKPDTHLPPNNIAWGTMVTSKGRKCSVRIEAWCEMRFRQKNNIPLHKYPFTMVRIMVLDPETGELVFKRPLWLMVHGDRRDELSLLEVYESYRRRYDIEHFFRFGKQRLLMEAYQTPDAQHEEHWWLLVILAYAQLYMAREISEKYCNPWERYLPHKTDDGRLCSPAEVQRYFRNLINECGTPAKPPKQRGRPLGRKLGQTQEKRKRCPVVKKGAALPQKEAA